MGEIRVLETADLEAALRLCAHDPIVNLFVASRISQYGIERYRLGCEVYGYFSSGILESMFHVGANLVPVNATNESIAAFVKAHGGFRSSSSIMGPATAVMALYEAMSQQWGRLWRRAREVRPNQPLMVIDHEPAIPADHRVQRIGFDHFDSYFDASVKMYTEEVGVSPLGPDSSYAEHVRRAIAEGRTYGIVENNHVIYKSDIGVWLGTICQVQGVWLHPGLRGRGISPGAMAGVVALIRHRSPFVSLYVNDFNTPAIRTYLRVGFRQIGQFATVLY